MLPFLLLLLVSASVLKSDCQQLRYVHVLWRHGDRAPLEKAYPNDPHGEENWPRGWAQLTTVGMKQMQDLGHFLRQRYAGTFLSARYDRKEVFVRSTDVDRTIESAQSLLSGMFPPEQGERFVPDFNWQPVAIHSSGSNKRDPLLHPWTFPCPLYQKLFVPIRDESDRRLMSKYKNLVDFVQPHLGLPQGQAVKIMDMMHLRHIMPEIIHNLTQPEWVLQKWPQHENKTSIELIWEMRAQNRLPNFNGSEEITKLIGGVLLADWLKRAEAIASGNQSAIPTKMTMYSAHDATLLVLLSALKVAVPEDSLGLPPYASCIIMELYGPAEGAKEDEFHVKFVYRRGERLEELVLDGCPTANCPLATFSALVRPRAILNGEPELIKMCTIDDQHGSNIAGRTENATIRWLFLHFGISLFLAFFRKL